MAALPERLCQLTRSRATRVDGGVSLEVVRTPTGSGLRSLAERGGFRGRVTNSDAACEVYLLNPAGGLAGGDCVAFQATVGCDARLVVSTATPERVYRSAGSLTRVDCQLTAGAGATLEWLPQQMLFYDGCRYRRTIRIDAELSARVTVLEAIALGRTERGEQLDDVVIRDDWRVWRDGRLVFADALRLEGAASRLLERAATGSGACAAATLVHVSPDAESALERVRACLSSAHMCGASAVDGVVVARWVAPSPMELAVAVKEFLLAFRGRAAPRGW